MALVTVLSGGTSDEREVSLRSGKAVMAALEKAGHEVRWQDPADGLDKDLLRQSDVVFPVLHGAGGEDGSIQQVLDDLGVKYVGSGVAASQLCFDKARYKVFLKKNEIPVPDGLLVSAETFKDQEIAKKPFVLKPNDGGSSVDTFIVRDVATADWSTMETALEKYGQMLMDTLIEGTEITMAVLGNEALPVIEIIPPRDGEFDYDNKYNGKSQEICPPENVAEDIQTRARELALEIHKLCGCRDFSRTDMMISNRGDLFVLETNTIPGMTDQSLMPKAAQQAGLSMEQLVDKLVGLALAAHPGR